MKLTHLDDGKSLFVVSGWIFVVYESDVMALAGMSNYIILDSAFMALECFHYQHHCFHLTIQPTIIIIEPEIHNFMI